MTSHEDFGDFIQGQQQLLLPTDSPPKKHQGTLQTASGTPPRSDLDVAAEKVLGWLVPAKQGLVFKDDSAVAIGEAWESAVRLMGGGEQAYLHTAEVIRRLCGVLDTFPTISESALADIGEGEDINVNIDILMDSAREPDKPLQRGAARDKGIDLRVAELVWPEHSHAPDAAGNESSDLVAAYLRLAEMSNMSQ
ncbi:hypothetical protein GGI20_001116 [Coemansia sp. BCRC 34301]|nr:hypothetical protein GGI20_001116 [Coemansia sp. BCRC 34301]